MIPSKHLEAVGQMPWGRFVTTYERDYTPFSEPHLQVNHRRLGLDARAAPFFLSPLQTGHDFWSTFYKTTNSEYGSPVCYQPHSGSLSPTPLPQSGVLPTHVCGAVGSALTEAGTQDTAAKEARPAEERNKLHYVLGGKVFAPQQAKDEPQRRVELLYEEGVIESSHVCPACCKDHDGSARREAGLHYLLHLPVVPSPIASIKGAENVDNSAFLMGLTACGLRNSAYLQPFPRQCSCCAWQTELPYSCCFKIQTFPPRVHHSSTQPVAPVQPSREPVLTEYRASYAAEWAQPKIQQSSVHLPHHPILYTSF